ncbi:MAG: glycosyltransferase, partial [Oscillospiraceae bacterium]|nr:glycosyltransferase [Oscillospiraceae bacterium]
AACGQAAAEWMFEEAAPSALIAHNGVDLCRFYPDDQRAGPYTLGHIGRFTENKNHTFLIDVFSEIIKAEPGARLLLAGDGKLRAEIEAKTERCSLSHAVDFLGVRSDVQNVLARCDALCMPSLFEGLPVTLVEAQACGVPSLVSDTISDECNLTGDVEFLPLGAPPALWASRLLEYGGRARKNNTAALEAAGYSIRQTAAMMQRYYLDLNEGILRDKV